MTEADMEVLREQVRANAAEQHEIVVRVQKLVDQFHTQNVAQAEMRGDVTHIRSKVDEIEESLKKDFALRSEFAEVKGEWRRFLGLVLTSILLAVLGGIGWISKGAGR